MTILFSPHSEGALAMVGYSVDLDTIQDVAAGSDADILPAERDVWKAARVVEKNWWRSFGYGYVMDAIRTRLSKVIKIFYSLYFCLLVTTISLIFQALKEKEVPMVEEILTKTPSGDHRKIVVDIEVAKIASENLTTSEGRDAVETITGVTHDNAEEE
jgi:hypothetical protein